MMENYDQIEGVYRNDVFGGSKRYDRDATAKVT